MNWDLEDLFDIKMWKDIQDTFSNSINHPVRTINAEGKDIVESRDFPFYYQIIRSRAIGNQLYEQTYADQYRRLKVSETNISVFRCPGGLINLMIPIKIKSAQIAALVIPAILQGPKDMASVRNISNIIKIEQDELVDAIDEIKLKSDSDLKAISTMAKILAELLPKVTHQKATSDKKITELTALYKITNMITSTLELDKILKSILTFLHQSVQAKAMSIYIFNGMKRYSIAEANKEQLIVEQALANEVLHTKIRIPVRNLKKDYRFERLNLEHNSAIAFPLTVKDEVIGAILIFADALNFSESDMEFLSIVANQASIAIFNAAQFQEIKESSITDKLTGLYNRRHFMKILQNEVIRSQRTKSPLSVAIFDIDFFKNFNDTMGHVQGDKLLSELAEILKANVREIDTVGRYGGEEFIIVLPQTKSLDAKIVSERVRKAIENNMFEGQEAQPRGRITISLGLVTCMNGSMSDMELIKEADKNLYRAKAAGKNQVIATLFLDKFIGAIDAI